MKFKTKFESKLTPENRERFWELWLLIIGLIVIFGFYISSPLPSLSIEKSADPTPASSIRADGPAATAKP